mgnify:CR=1 FL=1
MARKIIKLPSMSRVVPGSKATLELPIGPTYRRVFFVATAAAALDITDFGRIDVLIDGKVVQTFKNATRLKALNDYYQRAADTFIATRAEFALHFERAELVDLLYRRAPGVGTADVQTFNIEIELPAGAPADISMEAFAEIDPMPQKLGVFFKIREYSFSSSVAGEVEIDKLPKGSWYSVLHLFKSDVTQIEVEANQTRAIFATKAIMERTQKEASPVKRVPQSASATHIDFITDGDLTQSLRTDLLNDFRIKATLGTPGAMDIVAETFDTLQGA